VSGSLPEPDLKPHVPAQPPGSEACGCCAGVDVDTPQPLFNRSGLSAIAYRVGTWSRFRSSLHAVLSQQDFKPLDQLQTRDDNDFTIGLIDAFSCAADVVTFYQERIANESYLRTATERVALQEMGKLIGYRMRPGVAAETWLAFALETPPTPPPTLSKDPGAFITGLPKGISLPLGLKVQSIPGQDEKPRTFETVEELSDARAEWNAMRPWLSTARDPVRNDTFTYLKGVANNIRSGDAVVILGSEFVLDPTSNRWDFRIVDSVTLDNANDRTLVTWKRGLGSLIPRKNPTEAAPQIHVFRKRAAAFGHNAPMWLSMSREFRTDYPDGPNSPTEWPSFTISPAGATKDGGNVDFDSVYQDVKNNSFVVLAKGGFNYSHESAPSGTYVELYSVENVAEVSRAQFALSGKVTRAQLKGDNYSSFRNLPRETTVFAASEQLQFTEQPVTTAITGNLIPVAIDGKDLVPGRRLIVRGQRATDGGDVVVQATLVAVHADSSGSGRCNLEISPPLTETLARDSVVIHANVALASDGSGVTQVLGSGNASQAFQRFELKQTPLTYRSSPNEIGAAAELTVRIGDVEWNERPTMFGASPTEHAYTINTDEQGRTFVTFGDGVRGARLPSGSNNVRAMYRKDLGVEGNVPEDRLTQLMTRPLGLKSVSNPIAAQGGADPGTPDEARDSIPLVTRTMGRAVSLLDYEDFARAFSGIAKARARMLQLASGPTVGVTIAGPGGALLTTASPVWLNLLSGLLESGDPHTRVLLLSARLVTFKLGIRVIRKPEYESATVLKNVETALREHFAFDARDLGQPVRQSELIAVAQNAAGVLAVDLTRLYRGTTPSLQTRLIAADMGTANGVVLGAELLTLDAAPFDQLEEMAG